MLLLLSHLSFHGVSSFSNLFLALEKPGKCPYIDESESCKSEEFYNECDLDNDTPCDNMICCESPCGRRCVSPKPGKYTFKI